MTEKPLYVQVAEALGCKAVFGKHPHRPGMTPAWYCACEDTAHWSANPWDGTPKDEPEIERYDTDWSVTGPLIERYGLVVTPKEGALDQWGSVPHGEPEHPWYAWGLYEYLGIEAGYGDTALEAVCRALLSRSSNAESREVTP